MRCVRLGRTELHVSRVGLGGIPLQRPAEDVAVATIRHCHGLGINFIDTSIAYGTSEARIGKAIEPFRDEIVVATKSGWRGGRDSALECLENSLTALRTPRIDLWQFHNVGTMEGYEGLFEPGGAMEAAEEALSSGKVLHVGLTSHSLDVAKEATASGHFETIQYPFNFVTKEPEAEQLPLVRQHDVGFIAMKPFGGGLLGPARLAIKYLLQFDEAVPDPGIETIEQADEIAALVNAPSHELSDSEWAEIEEIRGRLGSRFCRQCGYCQPCPQGIQISLVMITGVMWNDWPREKFIEWMTDAVDGARTCIECGDCETRCPYGLEIRETLKAQVAFYDRVTS
ncbi:aldo/keto reductase [Candidatus Bipolaricaulota bacterium]